MGKKPKQSLAEWAADPKTIGFKAALKMKFPHGYEVLSCMPLSTQRIAFPTFKKVFGSLHAIHTGRALGFWTPYSIDMWCQDHLDCGLEYALRINTNPDVSSHEKKRILNNIKWYLRSVNKRRALIEEHGSRNNKMRAYLDEHNITVPEDFFKVLKDIYR